MIVVMKIMVMIDGGGDGGGNGGDSGDDGL